MKISRNKIGVIRIITAVILLIVGILTQNLWNFYVALGLFIAGYLIVGYDVVISAFKNLFRGKVLDENFLMTIASVGAFFLGEYPEALAVMAFYQLGEAFQRYAVGKSRNSISSLMKIRPDFARIEVDGELTEVDPEEINEGDEITVLSGDKIPLDGVVLSGESDLNTSALTGESLPVRVKTGDSVMSGCVNLTGVIRLKVTSKYENSTVARILDLAENAAANKAKSENFITKFALVYTPIVVVLAVILAILPPIFDGNWARWIYTALNFLVVSCPCAVVISVPMSFFCGIGASAKLGLLIKGSNYVEMLAKADVFAFDKTGTLTKGEFSVVGYYPEEKKSELVAFAGIVESASSHPIAKAISAEFKGDVSGWQIAEESGLGMVGKRENSVILAGNAALLTKYGVVFDEIQAMGSIVYVAVNGAYVGAIDVADTVKEGTVEAIESLKKRGGKTVMLTGDNHFSACAVGQKVGVDEVYSQLLPANKVETLEKLIANKKKGSVVCYLGDGINDAPALMRADVGIAMGNIGSDCAVEAADAVLMYGDLRLLRQAINVCRKTIRVVKQNIVFALGIKVAIMVLAVFGLSNMWLSVFADVGVAIIAVLNAMRINLEKKSKKQG